MAKRLILAILLLLPVICSAQQGYNGKYFITNSLRLGASKDSFARGGSALDVTGLVKFFSYASPDTNTVLGVDGNGNVVLRTKGNGSGGSTDSAVFATLYALYDTAHNLRGYVNGLFTAYYTASQVNNLLGNYYDKTTSDGKYVKYTDTTVTITTETERKRDSLLAANGLAARVKYSDTAAMLLPYLNAINARVKYTDTASMLTAYRLGLLAKLNISDTAAMLAAYQAAILQRVKYGDTASMLANYQSAINARLKYTDTAGMLATYQTAINNLNANKINYSDTTTKVVTPTQLNDTILLQTLDAIASRGDSTHTRIVAGDTANGGGILSLFGDSFTLGLGGTAVTLPYPTLLGQYLHLTVKLHAHGGATAHHGTPHNTNGDLIDSMVNLETKPTANSKLGIVLTFNDACAHNADADYSTTNTAADINTFIDNAINNKSWTGKASDIFLATTWCPDTTKITTVCGAGMTMQRFRDFVTMVKGIGASRGIPVVDLFTAFYNRYNIGLIGSDFYHPKDEGHREAAGDMVAAIDYKIISHGGTLLDAPLYSPDGAPAMALEQGNVRVQNSLTINANPLWNSYLYIPPATNKISATIGYSSFQGVSVNNTWIGFNIYYNSGFKHQLTGYSGNIAFQSGTYAFLSDPTSGSADASSSQQCVAAFNPDGSIGLGGVLTRGTTVDLTNAAIKIWPTTYHITLGRGTQADSTSYNLFVAGTTAFNNYIVHQNGVDYTTGGKKYYVINQTNLRGQMLSAIPVADVAGAVANTTTVNGHALSSNVSVTAGDVGLGNVNNTSDANKPISTATQIALNLKVDSVYRKAGSDSVFITKNGTSYFAFRDSIGSGVGLGSVTSVSVVNANGFNGTVATATTTPAITLTTTVTGLLKGNGTAISAATSGTDYTTPSSTETVTNKSISGSTNTLTNIPNSALTNSTISGVSLGSNLFAHTLGYGLTGTSYNGSAAVTTVVDTSAGKIATQLYVGNQVSGYTPTTRAINTTSPLTGGGNLSADRTIAINDAAADGTTKGASTYTAADFNSTTGLISIDYTNGQAASTSNKGFLTNTDWNTFNGKQAALTLTTTGTGAATLVGATLNIPTPAGGGGSPGGSTNDFQYNNAGAFAAVGNVVRQAEGYASFNSLAQSSTITAPTTSGTVFHRAGVGLTYIDKYGYEKPLQTDLGFINRAGYEATEGGFNNSVGTTGNININGTYSQGALSGTSAITKYTRSVYTSAATAGSKCELYASTPQFFLGNTAYGGGMEAVFTFGAETFATTSRLFDGFESGGSGFSNADPSTFTNIIGISKDISETSNFLQFVHNDATGTATKVSTGVAFDNTAIYELVISVPPNSTTVDVTLYKKTTSGRTYISSAQFTSDLPAAGTFLNPHVWINNGTVASAIKLDFFKWSIQYQ
jgi:hypothetical protein